jgi:hypothetical protein
MRKITTSFAVCLLVALLCVGFTGCGKDIDPDYKPVTGTITLDGKPLADAYITFSPDGGGSTGSDYTDENGVYELFYAVERPGGKLGKNTVSITKDDASLYSDTEEGAEGGPVAEDMYELIPARYNTETELTATVEDKDNVINFDLESGN